MLIFILILLCIYGVVLAIKLGFDWEGQKIKINDLTEQNQILKNALNQNTSVGSEIKLKDFSTEAKEECIVNDVIKEAESIVAAARKEADEIKAEAKEMLEKATEAKEEADEMMLDIKLKHEVEFEEIVNIINKNKKMNLISDDNDFHYRKNLLKIIKDANKRYLEGIFNVEWDMNDEQPVHYFALNDLLKIANLYCDELIDGLMPNIYKKGLQITLQHILDTVKAVETLVPKCFNYKVNQGYIENKIKYAKEIYFLEEYKFRKKEEQRLIREQQREEVAAQREFERELKLAQKEQEKVEEALLKAREEAEKERENTERFEKLQEKIASLQSELMEARQRSERVLSMAQQTRQGWVYIISNIGSFGENMYKIGMTRRLDPMERVNELGDASVPFPFDVHAMIFCEDAPALESSLHQAFESKKTNLVNSKKEFFNVSLAEIKEKVSEFGFDVEFTERALASQYRDSIFARKPKMSFG